MRSSPCKTNRAWHLSRLGECFGAVRVVPPSACAARTRRPRHQSDLFPTVYNESVKVGDGLVVLGDEGIELRKDLEILLGIQPHIGDGR